MYKNEKVMNQINGATGAIDFLRDANMEEILAVANVVKILNGDEPNAKMSYMDYQIVQGSVDALDEEPRCCVYDDVVLPDEDGNCSLCGGELDDEGNCLGR